MIRVPEVRVIGQEGAQLGVILTPDALQMAEEQGLDLVEVAPNEKPPVCRIMDYGKYKYQQSKRLQQAKKKQKVILVRKSSCGRRPKSMTIISKVNTCGVSFRTDTRRKSPSFFGAARWPIPNWAGAYWTVWLGNWRT